MRSYTAALAIAILALAVPTGAGAHKRTVQHPTTDRGTFVQRAIRADLRYEVKLLGIPTRDFRISCRAIGRVRAACSDRALHTWFEGQTEPTWASWTDGVAEQRHRLIVEPGPAEL
jgi:hypothetical protein